MINRAEMIAPSTTKENLPLLSDQAVQKILRNQINAIRRSVELPIRIGHPYGSFGEDSSRSLFSFTGEEFSHFKDMSYKIAGKVESDRLQRIGLEVMKEYGLNKDISRPKYHNRGWTEDGVIDDRDGNSREMRLYPSQTIDGLAFERTREFVTSTGKTVSVSWEVVDNAPIFKINLRGKSKKSA